MNFTKKTKKPEAISNVFKVTDKDSIRAQLIGFSSMQFLFVCILIWPWENTEI